jgi:hypothetical protein
MTRLYESQLFMFYNDTFNSYVKMYVNTIFFLLLNDFYCNDYNLLKEHHLRALRFVPNILLLQRALLKSFQRKLDRSEGTKITLEEIVHGKALPIFCSFYNIFTYLFESIKLNFLNIILICLKSLSVIEWCTELHSFDLTYFLRENSEYT